MAASIFVSYRRADSAATCGRIYDRLADRFGRETIFKDVDSIPAGVDFRAHVSNILDQCALQLVVIGARWLSVTDTSGARRLDHPNDLVRLEIEAALRRNIPIIPLVVDGAAMPTDPQLPATLQSLAYRNALPVRYDPDFDKDVARLIEAIERLMPSFGAPIASQQAQYQPPAGAGQSALSPTPGDQAWDATEFPDYKRTRPRFDATAIGIKTIAIGNHRIDIQAGANLTGRQRIFYDGSEVVQGQKFTSFGHKKYAFMVAEDGRSVHYEVEVGFKGFVYSTATVDVRIWRDGVEIYRD